MVKQAWDVVIIGGGPAGSAAAITAAGLGCRALVLEAETFPRHHVGESLLYLWSLLEELGVAEEMDATFQHKYGSARMWGRTRDVTASTFKYIYTGRKYSLQVERSLFDQILLRRAEAVGATVHEGCRVAAVLWEGERAVGVRYRDQDGVEHEARAPWLIDASGRHGLISRQLGLRETDPFYPDLSVYGYFAGAERFAGTRSGDLYIEAVPYGWFWYIPLHTGEISVGLVSDKSSRPRLQELGAEAFLQEAIEQSSNVRELLAQASLSRGAYVTATSGYRSRRYAGPGWMLAGDAGSFIDPMWATGVAYALQNGLLSGAMVEAVQTGRAGEALAITEYDKILQLQAAHMHSTVKFVYRCNHLYADQPFWRSRRGTETDGELQVDLLRRLAREPSTPYFREVFAGFGVDDQILDFMHDARVPDAATAGMAQHPDAWVLSLAEDVTVRPALDLEGGRIVNGFEASNGTVSIFMGHPLMVAAFQAVDGRTTVRAILDGVIEHVPAERQLFVRVKLSIILAEATMRGILRARPALAADHAAVRNAGVALQPGVPA